MVLCVQIFCNATFFAAFCKKIWVSLMLLSVKILILIATTFDLLPGIFQELVTKPGPTVSHYYLHSSPLLVTQVDVYYAFFISMAADIPSTARDGC